MREFVELEELRKYLHLVSVGSARTGEVGKESLGEVLVHRRGSVKLEVKYSEFIYRNATHGNTLAEQTNLQCL